MCLCVLATLYREKKVPFTINLFATKALLLLLCQTMATIKRHTKEEDETERNKETNEAEKLSEKQKEMLYFTFFPRLSKFVLHVYLCSAFTSF